MSVPLENPKHLWIALVLAMSVAVTALPAAADEPAGGAPSGSVLSSSGGVSVPIVGDGEHQSSSSGASVSVHVISDDDHRLTGNGSIERDHGAVLIRVEGHDPARVSADGALSIGKIPVAVDGGGRRLLAKYHADADTVTEQAHALTKQGVHFAFHTVADLLAEMVAGTTAQVGVDAEKGSRKLNAQARALCMTLDQWHTDQQAAAAVVPEFRPYATISAKDVADCYSDMQDDS